MNEWTDVRSGRLLRRLAGHELIAEPAAHQRPTLPSEREWGKGYHYVIPIDGSPTEWDFEGSHYRIVEQQSKFYVWKKTKHCIRRKNRG